MRLFDRHHKLGSRPRSEGGNAVPESAKAQNGGHTPAAAPANGQTPIVRPAVVRPPVSDQTTMDETASARRFGELLVAEKVITRQQLDTALQMQTVARKYVPIGQVLLANKVITRKRLNQLLRSS